MRTDPGPTFVRTILLAALWLASGCGESGSDGENAVFQPEIIGGIHVVPGALRQVVGVTYGTERMPRCTGTLIRPKIVLTAAHCVCRKLPGGGWQDLRPTHVYVGDRPAQPQPGTRPYYPIVDRRIALLCASETSSSGVDIALLKLGAPVTAASPLDLAPDVLVDRATRYRIAGFGATNPAGTAFTYDKLEAGVPSISNDCTGSSGGQSDAAAYGCETGQEIVAGRRITPDTCLGDSGGPLLVSPQGDDGIPSDNNFAIAGVTSRSVRPTATNCGSGGIYERLRPAVRTWLNAAIQSLGG